MKKLISTLLIVTLVFTATISLAVPELDSNKSDTNWMVVLVSSSGKIVKYESGLTLILNRKDITNMLQFSERPARLTKQLSATELEQSWEMGGNSFEKDYPNAAIVINGQTQVVQLTHMSVTKDTIEFSLKQDGKSPLQEAAVGSTVMFIDSAVGIGMSGKGTF